MYVYRLVFCLFFHIHSINNFFTLNSLVFSKVYILDKGLLIFKHLNSLLLNKVGMKAKRFGTLIDFSSSIHSLRYSKRLIVVPVSWLFL